SKIPGSPSRSPRAPTSSKPAPSRRKAPPRSCAKTPRCSRPTSGANAPDGRKGQHGDRDLPKGASVPEHHCESIRSSAPFATQAPKRLAGLALFRMPKGRPSCQFIEQRPSCRMAEAIETLAGNLGRNLRYVRERRGLTQAQLAKLCGLPRSTVGNLETGACNPT